MAAYWIWCIDQACLIAANDVELHRLQRDEQTRNGKQMLRFVSGPRGWLSEDD